MTKTDTPATNLRALRQAAGITQQEVAFRSGLSLSTIARIERGGAPTHGVASALCAALGCTFDELLGPVGQAA